MFRRAFARGGLWFFGTVVVVWVVGGPNELGLIQDVDYSFQEQLIIPIILGVIVGGCVMFKTWYDDLEDEKSLQRRREEQELTEKEKNLGTSDDTR